MKNNKQSGVALVTVLLVAAVTIALAYGALTVSLNTLQGSKAAESSVQARLNAESGLDGILVSASEAIRASQQGISPEQIEKIISNEVVINNSGSEGIILHEAHQGTSVQKNGDWVFTARVDGLDPHLLSEARYTVEALFEVASLSSNESSSGETGIFTIKDTAVIATGEITISGSGNVTGDIYSKSNIKIRASSTLDGNVVSLGNPGIPCESQPRDPERGIVPGILISNTITITGDVYSACDIVFTQDGERIKGNATALGTITTPTWTTIPKQVAGYDPNNPVQPAVHDFSDPLDIDEFIRTFDTAQRNNRLEIGNNNKVVFTQTSTGVHIGGTMSNIYSNISSSIDVLGESRGVIRVQEFSMGGSGHLTIEGHVVIFSDGVVNLSGGNAKITIKENSSLTIVSLSKITLGSHLESQSANQFLVYSSTTDEVNSGEAGIPLSVGVYAPKAHIKIGGSGNFIGAVYGNTISVSGSGSVTLDPDLISQMTTNNSPTEIPSIKRR